MIHCSRFGFFPLLVVSLVCCKHGAAGNQPSDSLRQSEPNGGFSFVPPAGWIVKSLGEFKYKAAIGEAKDGFAPNINIQEETFNGKLEEYIKQSVGKLQAGFKGFQLLKQESFKTAAGTEGARLMDIDHGPVHLRQTAYVFGRDNTFFVITCSALAKGGEKLDAVFDKCLKTFRFDKK